MTSRRLALSIAVAVLVLGLGAGLRDRFDRWVALTEMPVLDVPVGVEVLARDGSLLRAFQVADGRWRLDAGPVDPLFLDMLMLWEDRRFADHSGVDLRAVLRAGLQAARHGRVVSGGSTLSMQVARLIEQGPVGQWPGKLRQIRLALALERRLDKRQILQLYLRLAPYGANVEGIRAASLQWFGKEPRRLSPAQAALLVALPQSPETRRPDRFAAAALAARNRVLARAAEAGLISQDDAKAAMAEPVPRMRRAFPAHAPLLAARLMREHPGATRIETTIDLRLQRRAEDLASRAVRGAGRRLSAAIVLADHRSGEILAEVGAADWTDGGSAGFVDMTRAWRSPGSTLKPFVYGLAFDDGLAHPETLIEDRPTAFGRWQPQNFDHMFRGTVSLRNALIWSLNIPVVKLADALGPNRVAQVLARGGITLRLPGEAPGLALVLGGGGVTLEGLAQGYAALARGGQGIALTALPGAAAPLPARMFGRGAAWQVGDVLAQNPAPHGARLRPMAYKTGTSYGHRDALAVGYDGAHVGAVWLGRPDGTPVPGAFGGDLAAPVLFDLFDALPSVALPPPPPQVLTLPNAALPLPLRRFTPPGQASAAVQRPAAPDALRLTYPPDGAEIDTRGPLIAKAQGGRGPWTFLLNGAPQTIATAEPQTSLPNPGPGFAQLTVIDADGAAATAAIRLH
ncbi:penicillin-binding protein 1C [Paracoccus shanxieyensis]|uniref:peptidoglycan glycosyltransferase n=1 Tax=Paracoccus shanxieyensis TaxID=2675752 RepID=A0A6L6IT04_9RHOB|nr:penicillin-binding protein 1C [Paracoccus shanxieyensis]MTH62738.1 penicillin-binding protein 1C [Paracoccus shanxieyensis]MTH86178.1 penicillin-binding protein 1C [Paracoccus shanxieyensis]